MEVITRKDAMVMGLKHYFTGIPCLKGHIGEKRLVSSRVCVVCAKNMSRNRLEKWKTVLTEGYIRKCIRDNGWDEEITKEMITEKWSQIEAGRIIKYCTKLDQGITSRVGNALHRLGLISNIDNLRVVSIKRLYKLFNADLIERDNAVSCYDGIIDGDKDAIYNIFSIIFPYGKHRLRGVSNVR